MQTSDGFQQCLTVMENAFRRLEIQVPPPQLVPWRDRFVMRHKEQTIRQALIQKLARVVSGLNAVNVLVAHGLFQEQAVLHRTLDDLREDIFFLGTAITNDRVTPLHEEFLKAFFAEEFDEKETLARIKKPDPVKRTKIRAYVTRILSIDPNPSAIADTAAKIHSVNSGYVHAGSPQVMDMCGGNPPRFHTTGMLNTPRMMEYVDGAWDYFCRGLMATTFVGKAFGDTSLVENLIIYLDRFECARVELCANVEAQLAKN